MAIKRPLRGSVGIARGLRGTGFRRGLLSSPAAAGPTPPQGNLVQWWSADSGAYNDAGVTLATNGQTVQQWDDRTASDSNASQATAGSRPTFNTSVINGLPALTGDGVDNFDTISNQVNLGNAYSLFIAFRWEGNAGVLLGNNEGGAIGTGYAFYVDGTTLYHNINISAGYFATASHSMANPSWHLMEIIRTGANIETVNFWLDGTSLSMTYNGSGSPGNNCRLSAIFARITTPLPFAGKIAEILAYNTNLSVANRQSVESYISTRYGFF